MVVADERTWQGGTQGGGFGNRIFVKLAASAVGRAVAPCCIFCVALYFMVVWPAARRASGSFANHVGRGRTPLRRLMFSFDHFRTYGEMLFDRLVFLSNGPEAFGCEFPDWEVVSERLARGKGIVLVSAHQGNWEPMAQLLASRSVPVTIVMHDGIPAEARAALERLHSRRFFRIIVNDGTPASAAAILADLREGRFVGIMGDRLLGSRGCKVPFLDGKVSFPTGPYVLSAAAGAPLLHAFAERVGPRRYLFHCYAEPLSCDPCVVRARVPVEHRVAAFSARLEELVRRRPEQWGNFYDFWKDTAS